MKLSFSLNAPKKAGSSSLASSSASLKKPSAFGGDDDTLDAAPTASSSKSLDVNRRLAAQNVSTSTFGGSLSRTQKQKLQQAKELDPTVFEYDEVYDQMKEAQARVKQAKEEDPEARKPKYIGNLLTSAATRKLDYVRAEEKLIQREREAEGDEFADKEKFVTQAYKDQMAEIRRAEEEEKLREAAERAKKTSGMSHFYRELLQQSEIEHAATMAATTVKGPTLPDAEPQNLRIQKPLKQAALSDAMLAAIAREDGKDVELNDDNQIVDHRDLLSAGLNLGGVNTRRIGGITTSRTAGKAKAEPVETHRAAGTAATKAEIRARQNALLQEQLAEEEVRVRTERERREEEERERTVKRKNDASDVQSARDRYLERKRRRLEEPPPQDDS
ncbi:hypothetical protein DL93DRAFT_2083167 [Clavulina sp. PMI_390]|nr:hypothetical protein DL93DRAFT_2083167 [Clavulina sp. PMI_390]